MTANVVPSTPASRAVVLTHVNRLLTTRIRSTKLAPKIPHAKFVLVPISDATRGHGTHTEAAVWKNYLIQLLAESEKK